MINENQDNQNILHTNNKNISYYKDHEYRYRSAYESLIFCENLLQNRINEVKLLGTFEKNITIPKFFFLPSSMFKKIWDIFIISIVIYTIYIIPLEFGLFIKAKMEINNSLYTYKLVEYMINIILGLDILFQFRTAIYLDKGQIITNTKIISSNYLRSYFIADVISIIPLDSLQGDEEKTNYYLFLLKIPRLIRIIKIFKFISKISYTIVLRLILLFFLYIMIAHYFACIISFLENYKDPFNFVSTNDLTKKYVEYVINSMVVLGGNLMNPPSYEIRILHTIMFFIGMLCDSVIFGNMAMYFANYSPMLKFRDKRMNEMSLFVQNLNINADMKNEISDYTDSLWWKSRDTFLGTNYIKDLNKSLKIRTDIIKYKESLFKVCKIFEKFSSEFMIKLISKMKTRLTHPNEIITFEGKIDQRLYFISKRGIYIVRTNGNNVAMLKEGDYFGEIACFLKSLRRVATVISVNISTLHKIEGKQIMKLIYDFPFEAKELYKSALDRFKQSYNYLSIDLVKKLYKTDGTRFIWNDDIIEMIRNLTKKDRI